MSSSSIGASSGDELPRLVQRAADGDQRAWSLLVGRFERLVLGAARSAGLSEADANDAAQMTWLRLFQNLSRINDASRLGGWLVTTVRRESLRVRGRGAHRPLDDESGVPEWTYSDTTLDDLFSAERDAALRSLLARLPERDRTLLNMLTSEPPNSYAEIGAAMGMPVGSIGPTRARSLSRLVAAATSDPDALELLN